MRKEVKEVSRIETKKVYKEVRMEAKNSPRGSYAAGCPETYGDPDAENCYICDYGG